MRIVDRYTAREFFGPFFAAVGGFTVMLLSGLLFELTDLIVDKKMAIETVIRMLFYRIPGVVVVTLPIAVLFGTLLSLTRLAKDSELTVFLSTGTPFRRLAAPILVLAALVSLVPTSSTSGSFPRAITGRKPSFAKPCFAIPCPRWSRASFSGAATGESFTLKRSTGEPAP